MFLFSLDHQRHLTIVESTPMKFFFPKQKEQVKHYSYRIRACLGSECAPEAKVRIRNDLEGVVISPESRNLHYQRMAGDKEFSILMRRITVNQFFGANLTFSLMKAGCMFRNSGGNTPPDTRHHPTSQMGYTKMRCNNIFIVG